MRRLLMWFTLAAVPGLAQTPPPVFDATHILDIRRFLDICPANDPAFAQIQADFQFRRNNAVSPMPACTEPVSEMPVAQITDELLWMQVFRVAYYMDRGRSNYLPWTPLRFYDWVKSKIAGVNIASLSGGVAGSCCGSIGGKLYFNANLADDLNKTVGVRPAGALAKLALLLGHEVRHVDGFPHVSCCLNGSCDQTYDEKNLSPYGIGMWMTRALFIDDRIQTGLECDYAGADINERLSLYQTYTNSGTVFCDAKPPTVPKPAIPPDFTKCGSRTPTLFSGAVTNAANYSNTAVATGELLTAFSFGIDVGSTTGAKLGPDGRVITKLDNTKLIVNGIESPLIYVAPGQLSGITPWDLGSVNIINGQVSLPIEVVRKNLLSQPVFVPLSPVDPGIFTVDASGNGPAAALNEDNSVNTASNPAAKGSIVQLFVTGTGPFTGVANSANDGLLMTTNIPALFYTAAVTVDGEPAKILYSGQAPGQVAGVSQVNVRIPLDLTRSGAVSLKITMNSSSGASVGAMRAGNPTVFVQ